LVVIATVVAAIAAASAWLYFDVWSYQRTAHRHVPAGTNVAVRADAGQILLFKPVREHLWPVLLESDGASDADKKRRIQLIHDKTGVSVPQDLREVIVASVDAGSWVALIGGNIEPGRFVTGLDEVLREEGVTGWTLDGELLVHDYGPAIGQADDGTLAIGTNRDITMAALPAADDDSPMLPDLSDDALSFVINHKAYEGAVDLLPLTLPGLDTLSKVEQLHGHVVLTDNPTVELVVTPKGVDAAALASELDGSLAKVRIAVMFIPHHLFGAKEALGDASITATGNEVLIRAPWPYEALDKAAKKLAISLAK